MLAAGTVAVALPATAAALGCSVTYSVTNQWPGGFNGAVAITNLGGPISSWTLTFDFPDSGQKVAQGWSANWSQSGTHVTAANASWNGSLATNASTSIGFTGSDTGANPVPTTFSLNGTVCTGAVNSPSPSPSTGTTSPPPTVKVLNQVNTAGRVQDNGSTVQYTWPGVYFEGRVHGTGVGIVLNDANNDYDVQVDGATVATVITPGQTTYWVNNLSNTDHTVRLVKRTESQWAAGQFGGFVAAPGGSILNKPVARSRQIEFIGDSYTAGYGNLSTTRDCSTNGGVTANSDADKSFGALTAHSLNADYQINAWSGMGMVRNYGGSSPGTDFRTYYDRTLQAVNTDPWPVPGTWRPQLVVVGLGINDFSTALNANEPWSTVDQLVAAYKTAYQGFIDKLRSRYGTNAIIVVSATLLSNTTVFASTAQQIVKDRNAAGDSRVYYWYYDDPNLDRMGCDWHPSAHDDQIISGLLNTFIATLPLHW
ncbi:hypothetical protein Raf01_24980 [Rugosimonospora africana]|uniref:CBM2 domain-containing protein n=1 Tax=Rugosimonospora africana TaxID=556532 RepID=A0A8J3QPY3_9ACTN|nr:hypothetical protein Raf01_24980 [Rugosimonospora africana]